MWLLLKRRPRGDRRLCPKRRLLGSGRPRGDRRLALKRRLLGDRPPRDSGRLLGGGRSGLGAAAVFGRGAGGRPRVGGLPLAGEWRSVRAGRGVRGPVDVGRRAGASEWPGLVGHCRTQLEAVSRCRLPLSHADDTTQPGHARPRLVRSLWITCE